MDRWSPWVTWCLMLIALSMPSPLFGDQANDPRGQSADTVRLDNVPVAPGFWQCAEVVSFDGFTWPIAPSHRDAWYLPAAGLHLVALSLPAHSPGRATLLSMGSRLDI